MSNTHSQLCVWMHTQTHTHALCQQLAYLITDVHGEDDSIEQKG